ncbi:cobalamin biosynthesis protein CobD [Sphingomonas changnyeongensis]|uniref:Cobalamin biosynthesis protein CobD n=2 Tax=Sphingomonas changnyeongensis TaxID=2698679 RepID=A0A7Z2NXX0_9SPHN|nr:cobalamin biosynthesis protein CobD [Sphingomonas changnyeongensis]
MLAALMIEAVFGWPDRLTRRIGHPVIWIGALIARADAQANRPYLSHRSRYLTGAAASIAVIAVAAAIAGLIAAAVPGGWPGLVILALCGSSLIAARSLYDHVAAVAAPLAAGDLAGARAAVARIVGRDPALLDDAGVARAAIESLAENMSDGVVAPLFWGVLFGLPGLAAYKAINTLDSMIGHRTARHLAFGGFAARLDDVANLVPARLTGLLLALAALSPAALGAMLRDARRHRSPNAGWPEAAMAGAIGVRLSGPRAYQGRIAPEPWLNGTAPDPDAGAIRRALGLYVRALAIMALALLALMLALGWR